MNYDKMTKKEMLQLLNEKLDLILDKISGDNEAPIPFTVVASGPVEVTKPAGSYTQPKPDYPRGCGKDCACKQK